MKRSMYAGRVHEEHIGQEMTLKGWVGRRRDLGGLIFTDNQTFLMIFMKSLLFYGKIVTE